MSNTNTIIAQTKYIATISYFLNVKKKKSIKPLLKHIKIENNNTSFILQAKYFEQTYFLLKYFINAKEIQHKFYAEYLIKPHFKEGEGDKIQSMEMD